jgi:uncharacterized tellurite resistance protein B-like protein
MHEQDKAILQGLVSVAWADGKFEDREKEMINAFIEEFGATEDEAKELRDWAATKRGLEDINLNELSFGDRRNLMGHAVTLAWVDGDHAESEKKFLLDMRDYLKISEDEFSEIEAVHTQRAKDLLKLLEDEG